MTEEFTPLATYLAREELAGLDPQTLRFVARALDDDPGATAALFRRLATLVEAHRRVMAVVV